MFVKLVGFFIATASERGDPKCNTPELNQEGVYTVAALLPDRPVAYCKSVLTACTKRAWPVHFASRMKSCRDVT